MQYRCENCGGEMDQNEVQRFFREAFEPPDGDRLDYALVERPTDFIYVCVDGSSCRARQATTRQ